MTILRRGRLGLRQVSLAEPAEHRGGFDLFPAVWASFEPLIPPGDAGDEEHQHRKWPQQRAADHSGRHRVSANLCRPDADQGTDKGPDEIDVSHKQ